LIVTYKVRLHPNIEQEQKLFESAGIARYAYNWTLGKQEENYKNGNKFIQDGELRKEFTKLKNDEVWLNNYSNNITKQAIKDACNAYKKFFKGLSKYPKFKSRKHTTPSFYQDTYKIKFKGKLVRIEKVGWINIAEEIPVSKYWNPRITFDGLNWYLSIGVEEERLLNSPKTEPIGIDLGIKDLAVVSNGQFYKNINKTKKMKKLKKRLKRQQKRASKLYEKIKRKELVTKSNNLKKLELQIKKTYKTMTNIRTNHIHQMTSKLVKANPEYIVIEDLNIKGMMKNKHLSDAIQEQKLYEVIRQFQYKCEWYVVKLIQADRFYPSSKTCSECGYIHRELNLKDRTFICPSCGFIEDRDYNASINLREYGRLVA
jgi:putative transposase